MSMAEITVSIDEGLLHRLDGLVQARVFPDRSQAVQSAVQEQLARHRKARLAEECAKLDLAEEQAMADEGLASEIFQRPPH